MNQRLCKFCGNPIEEGRRAVACLRKSCRAKVMKRKPSPDSKFQLPLDDEPQRQVWKKEWF